MASDLAVMELLDRAAVSYGLVLTKIDELKPARRTALAAALAAEARKHTAALAEISGHLASRRPVAGIRPRCEPPMLAAFGPSEA